MRSIKILLIVFAAIFTGICSPLYSQVKITDGAVLTMDPNSLLELESTNKGLLIPRVTLTSLILPAPLTAPVPTGMLIYNTGGSITNGLYAWNGAAWIPFATGIGSQWITNGSNIYYNTGSVGIGSSIPAELLDVKGNLKIGDTVSGTIRATKELVLRQDGDVFGSSILRLRNRNAENGAIFETTDGTTTLIDFIFKTAVNQRNIRYEARSLMARTGAPSFHLGGLSPDSPTLSLGDNYAAFNKNVRIGDYTTPSTALDVNGQITLRTGATAGAVLVSDVNGTGTWTGIGSVYNAPVIKTANATLLKTENLVLASGDITLRLPVVTGADNGLTISIKNIGTYMDQITVTGATGAELIDATTSSMLYRVWGRTYIAYNGNWLRRENTGRTDNVFDVSAKSSWTTIAQVVEFLGAHMTGPSVVLLGGGTHQIAATQTINLPYPVTFEGVSYGETTIDGVAGVSGSPLFSCASECYFKMLNFNAYSNSPGNDGIRFTGSGAYHEVKDCYLFGFNKGIVSTSNNDIWVFESDFDACSGAGIEIAAGAASGGSLKISECDFTQCAKGISLLSGVSETISLTNSTFYNTASGTDIGILYTPATFITMSSIFITNNAWNNQGSFINGFDFTRSDGRDANVFLVNNAGLEDAVPHCKINVVNNGSTTTCTNANVWYKANWTNTSSYTVNFIIGNNKMTYQSLYARDVFVIISGNVLVSAANRNITICMVKNGVTGTRYGETTLRITTANQPFQFSTVIYLSDVVRNDYLELFCSSVNSADALIFQDINIFVNSQ